MYGIVFAASVRLPKLCVIWHHQVPLTSLGVHFGDGKVTVGVCVDVRCCSICSCCKGKYATSVYKPRQGEGDNAKHVFALTLKHCVESSLPAQVSIDIAGQKEYSRDGFPSAFASLDVQTQPV